MILILVFFLLQVIEDFYANCTLIHTAKFCKDVCLVLLETFKICNREVVVEPTDSKLKAEQRNRLFQQLQLSNELVALILNSILMLRFR